MSDTISDFVLIFLEAEMKNEDDTHVSLTLHCTFDVLSDLKILKGYTRSS